VVGAGAAVAALTLATFVPERGTGRLVDLGCGSCAVAVAMGSVLAVWWLATAPVETWSAGLALGITLAALGKRLTDPVVCAR
jgi:diaminopimelate epimerase